MPYCITYLMEDDGYIVAWDGSPSNPPKIWEYIDFEELCLESNVHAPLWDVFCAEGNEDAGMMFESLPPGSAEAVFRVNYASAPELVTENDTVYWRLWVYEDHPFETVPMKLSWWEETHTDSYEVIIETIQTHTFQVRTTSPEQALEQAKGYVSMFLEGAQTTPPEEWAISLTSPAKSP